MHLRHISPGSNDWKDAMDEGKGAADGRGWHPKSGVKLCFRSAAMTTAP